MDVPTLHARAVESFGRLVEAIRDDQWDQPTPDPEWSVRDLVNHVTAELLWMPPLLAGRTIEEVGDRYDGDVLGEDPRAAWRGAARGAVEAAREPGAMARTVHISAGDFPGEEYANQLLAENLVHGWDLARAIGADERLDPDLVAAATDWFGAMEDVYRSAGAIGPRPDIPRDADPQTVLLAMFGRAR